MKESVGGLTTSRGESLLITISQIEGVNLKEGIVRLSLALKDELSCVWRKVTLARASPGETQLMGLLEKRGRRRSLLGCSRPKKGAAAGRSAKDRDAGQEASNLCSVQGSRGFLLRWM